MSTAQNIITYARQLSQTDSNGLTDTLGLAFSSDALQNFTRSLVERNINAAQIVEAYATTSSTFAWPSDMWSLKTIETNYVDTSANNFLQAQELEIANAQNQSFDWVRANQPTTFPLFGNHGDTGEIFPNQAATVKIFYFQIPTEYATTSDPLTYPVTLDFRCLGARVAALYKSSLGDFNAAAGFNTEYQKRLDDIIRILAPASQQPIKAEPLHISGFQF